MHRSALFILIATFTFGLGLSAVAQTTEEDKPKQKRFEDLTLAELWVLSAEAKEEADAAQRAYEAAVAREREAREHLINTCGSSHQVVAGALDKSVIDRVVKQNLDDIRACYSRVKEQDSELPTGIIQFHFFITQDGSVSSVEVQSSEIKNEQVESCVVGIIDQMQFPTPAGGPYVETVYPIVFR